MIWYDGRLFRPVNTSGYSETSADTIFRYKQRGDILTADYAGGDIEYGHILGLVDEDGRITMRYHHLNHSGAIMTGKCKSKPEILPNGKLRLHERWEWTCGTRSKGTSLLEEI